MKRLQGVVGCCFSFWIRLKGHSRTSAREGLGWGMRLPLSPGENQGKKTCRGWLGVSAFIVGEGRHSLGPAPFPLASLSYHRAP
jgi:hypothetical protein